jgi:hypothetical protein
MPIAFSLLHIQRPGTTQLSPQPRNRQYHRCTRRKKDKLEQSDLRIGDRGIVTRHAIGPGLRDHRLRTVQM